MKYAAININFDSLGEIYGFPAGYHDPSFFEVADRFFAIADKYAFKYSIYVVGKDLEKAENRQAVKRWHERGHEIGSHSWSHRGDLGALAPEVIGHEVGRAHELISETIGEPVKGFIAPGWSTSRRLLETLLDLGYEYDTSSFPSWIMYPALAKLTINFIRDRRLTRVWNRKDFALWLCGPRHPYLTSGGMFGRGRANGKRSLVVLPMPTNRLRVACWHTMGFMIGWDYQRALLRDCLKSVDAFYYLAHPADLLGVQDLDTSRVARFERMGTSLDEKIARFDACIRQILDSGRTIVPLSEIARRERARLLGGTAQPAPRPPEPRPRNSR